MIDPIWFFVVALIVLAAVYAIVIAVDKADERRAQQESPRRRYIKVNGAGVGIIQPTEAHGEVVTPAKYPEGV